MALPHRETVTVPLRPVRAAQRSQSRWARHTHQPVDPVGPPEGSHPAMAGRKGASMRDLNYDFKQLGMRNRDGSYTTQANRARTLSLIADQLYALGYKQLHATELKCRHVNALATLWLGQGLLSLETSW